ncbi:MULTISPECIES: CPBP family intramembrane glutamic endopeptidase [Pseudonocardia]|uniref:CAAX amino terminal protease self-immunity n=1 Tax=Pseudonocardia autotrophica TaxID=2074 RepID=A0A1Y2NAP1_PSEAH|nr:MULTISPECIES: CPBP family intramembrane glutamic endopeptidase [Pseudonocardia]OSY43968.1 CAAX amino terminal protease self- immunity [Pseudonocardia autotrophica]TDN74299.1 CAAX prenyl protease-like protein [Pseudonocardia autotrophica]BBG05063.1 hypothetical protein Pdca_62720 [Pseudonocardia autotrophica]
MGIGESRTGVTESPVDTARWVVPVLAVVGAGICLVTLIAGPAAFTAAGGPALLSGLLAVAVLAPLALFAARGRPGAGRALVVAGGLVVLTHVVHTLPRVGVFAGLDWNWQGKTLELLWLAVLLLVLHRWARTAAGLRRPEPGTLGPALRLIVGWFLVVACLVAFSLADFGPVDGERMLFDVAHPNLVEELLWRGVLLAVLDRALGAPWRFFGARVGWGLVLTSVGFGLGHGLLVTGEGLLFDPAAIVLTGFAGLLLGWVRAYTGSVWLAYLAHCAPEVGIAAGELLRS